MKQVMKILLLNPYIDATHDVAKLFQKRGIGLLISGDPIEAWQILQLHGSTIELAIVHREIPPADSGMSFIEKVKKDSTQSDLPIILSSEKWEDLNFAKHQQSAQGVNAYIKYPFSETGLFELIEGVVGAGHAEGQPKASQLVLEDAAKIFKKNEKEVAFQDLL